MPQGGAGAGGRSNAHATAVAALAASEHGAPSGGVAGRPRAAKKGGPLARHRITPALAAALPGLTRNIEQMAAARLVRSGATVRLTDVKKSADAEAALKRAEKSSRAAGKAVSAILARGKNAKGVRGEFDANELAELDPELKTLLEHRRVTSGGGKAGAKAGAKAAEDPFAGVAAAAAGEAGEDSGDEGAGAGAASSAAMPRAGVKRRGGGGTVSGGKRVAALEKGAGGGGGGAKGGDALFASDAAVAAQFGADFL
jgi:hypothetical protein